VFKIGVWKYTYKNFNWIEYSFNNLLFYSIPTNIPLFHMFHKIYKKWFLLVPLGFMFGEA